MSYTTIKVYLPAVRNMHVATGYQSIYSSQLTPRLQQILKGIKKTQTISQPPRIRRSITLDINFPSSPVQIFL